MGCLFSGCTAGILPVRVKISGRMLGASGETCTVIKMATGRSPGKLETSVFNGPRDPAEPPITTISRWWNRSTRGWLWLLSAMRWFLATGSSRVNLRHFQQEPKKAKRQYLYLRSLRREFQQVLGRHASQNPGRRRTEFNLRPENASRLDEPQSHDSVPFML